jgi:hypothetical protein
VGHPLQMEHADGHILEAGAVLGPEDTEMTSGVGDQFEASRLHGSALGDEAGDHGRHGLLGFRADHPHGEANGVGRGVGLAWRARGGKVLGFRQQRRGCGRALAIGGEKPRDDVGLDHPLDGRTPPLRGPLIGQDAHHGPSGQGCIQRVDTLLASVRARLFLMTQTRHP